ncbi:MAG: WD40/YVTN/BNR-like repeat-containing protein [Solirubrobacterales bacterium]
MTDLLAATSDGVARVAGNGDGGWSVKTLLDGGRAQCIAADPGDPNRLFAGSHGRGVWKSADGGASWHDAALPADDVFSLAVSPVDGAVYAGCEPSMLFRSRDGGEGWEELSSLREIPSAPSWSFPPRPWTSHVRWIAPSPHDADRILAGIELGGVMLSEDGGATWKDHRPGAQPDCHALAWHPRSEGRAYEAGGGGAAWSSDGGETWRGADEGRDRNYTWALAVDPEDPERWYVSASTGPMQAHGSRSAEAHMYRWRGEGPWERLTGGLSDPLDSMPYALAAADGALFAGFANGEIHRSDDRGDSWRSLPLEGDTPERILALVPLAGASGSG